MTISQSDKMVAQFVKDITRWIPPVVYFDEVSDKTLQYELDEYHLSTGPNSIAAALIELFTNMLENIDSETQGNIWLSGSFGAGKSMLAKYLGLCLDSNQMAPNSDQHISELFFSLSESISDGNQLKDLQDIWSKLRAAIGNSKSILFDIGAVSTGAKKLSQSNSSSGLHVHETLLQEVQRSLEFGTHLSMIRSLFGNRDDVQRSRNVVRFGQYLNQHKLSWSKFTRKPKYAQGLLYSKFLHASNPRLYQTETSWYISLSEHSFDVEDVAFYVEQMRLEYQNQNNIDNMKLFIVIDEIYQHIYKNEQEANNLESIAENLFSHSPGQIWLLVTAQKSLDDISQNTLSETIIGKLKDRLPSRYRVSLHPSNITEVVQQRMLIKNKETEAFLLNLVKKNVQPDHSWGYVKPKLTIRDFNAMVAIHPLGIQSIDFYFRLFDEIKIQSTDSASDSTSIRGLMQFLNGFYQSRFASHFPVEMSIVSYITIDMVFDQLKMSLPRYVRDLVRVHVNKYKRLCELGKSQYGDHETALPIRILKGISLINLAEEQCTEQRIAQYLRRSIGEESLQIDVRTCLENELYSMVYKKQSGLAEVYALQPSILGRINREVVDAYVNSDDERQTAMELLVKCALEGTPQLDYDSVVYERTQSIRSLPHNIYIKSDLGSVITSTIQSPIRSKTPFALKHRHIPILLLFANNENPESIRQRALELSKKSNNGSGVIVFMCVGSRTLIDKYIDKYLDCKGTIEAAENLLDQPGIEPSDRRLIDMHVKQQHERIKHQYGLFSDDLTQILSSSNVFVAYKGKVVDKPVPRSNQNVSVVNHLPFLLEYCQNVIFNEHTPFNGDQWTILLENSTANFIPEQFQNIGILSLVPKQFSHIMASFEYRLTNLVQGNNSRRDELEQTLRKCAREKYVFTDNQTHISVNLHRIYSNFLAAPYGFSATLISTLITGLVLSKENDLHKYALYSVENGVLKTYVDADGIKQLFASIHSPDNNESIVESNLSRVFISTWQITDMVDNSTTQPILALFKWLRESPFTKRGIPKKIRLEQTKLGFTLRETEKMRASIFYLIDWLRHINQFFSELRLKPKYAPFAHLLHPPVRLVSLYQNLQYFQVPPGSQQLVELLKGFYREIDNIKDSFKSLLTVLLNWKKIQSLPKPHLLIQLHTRVVSISDIIEEFTNAQLSIELSKEERETMDRFRESFSTSPWDITETVRQQNSAVVERIDTSYKEGHTEFDESIALLNEECKQAIEVRINTHDVSKAMRTLKEFTPNHLSDLTVKHLQIRRLKRLLISIETAPPIVVTEPPDDDFIPTQSLQLSHEDYKTHEELRKHVETIESQCIDLLKRKPSSTVTIK